MYVYFYSNPGLPRYYYTITRHRHLIFYFMHEKKNIFDIGSRAEDMKMHYYVHIWEEIIPRVRDLGFGFLLRIQY